MNRLYILTRADLPPGLLTAQCCHVTRKFTRRFLEVPVDEDENLVVLSAADEPTLLRLEELLQWEVPLATLERFQEPDLGGQVTALAVHGGASLETALRLRKLLSSLPCALRPSPAAKTALQAA